MRIVLLGSSSSIPTSDRDNTGLFVEIGGEKFLIDCGGSIEHKLCKIKVNPDDISHMIVTHSHTDHIYGIPLLIHNYLLKKRQERFTIYGPREAMDTISTVLDAMKLSLKRLTFPLNLRVVPLKEGFPLFYNERFEIHTHPLRHSRDTIALRFTEKGGSSFAYCTDTGFFEDLSQFISSCDILFHDSAAPHRFLAELSGNHSTSLEAGMVASKSGVKKLVLIHMDFRKGFTEEEIVNEAREVFSGEVVAGRDLMMFDL